jgi:hypothetical protein
MIPTAGVSNALRARIRRMAEQKGLGYWTLKKRLGKFINSKAL